MIPEQFVMPVSYQPDPSHQMLMKPVFGTIDGQFVRFFMLHDNYSDAKSKIMGYEVQDPLEMVEIVCDRLTKAHIKVKDMSAHQRRIYSDLYERFKQGKESVGTHITEWNAISEGDRALLVHCNVFTVEQLAEMTPENMHRLGPAGSELQEKAKRHTKSKSEKFKAEEVYEEMRLLREELEKMKAKNAEKDEQYFERVSAQEKKGRSKQVEHIAA